MKTETIKKYTAKDGTVFDNRQQCLHYEKREREMVLVYDVEGMYADGETFGDGDDHEWFYTTDVTKALAYLKEIIDRSNDISRDSCEHFVITLSWKHPDECGTIHV